ncbi:hypothetical protein [Streptomyces sp. SAJ15]|uniref:hypothetical protein n=1 Tax=Streptomyces sp. SAJ15 TaxID=2011095 RepID=UPI0011854360|nr:hypothetical protein [Streptomyces sp. SAJ15]TVL91736.1 hypothetical protein CD790_13555 [Streptomyces sp. SAJ15]
MVSVPDLDAAKPQQWRDAADDVLKAAKHCEEIATAARDDVARTLERNWASDAGKTARQAFVRHATDYEAAALALRALTRVYDGLAAAIENAQRDLNSAQGYARTHNLTIDDSGRVHSGESSDAASDDSGRKETVRHAQGVVNGALSAATTADIEAAAALRTIRGLTDITDPKVVNEALKPDSPLSIALRLAGGSGGVHPINVSASQIAAADRASRETGISKTLLLSILWQEQQWYQNHDRDGRGILPSFGRWFNWTLRETIVPDKSLGITHMKLETARKTIGNHPDEFTADGKSLGDLSDSELAKYIEENPNEDIRLSAYHLSDLQQNPYGAKTDKQLFILYAADTPEVREANEKYGDDSDPRGGAIKSRAENWDRLQPHIEDAKAWEGLSEEERQRAIDQLESQTPKGDRITLDPIYEVEGPDAGMGTDETKRPKQPGLIPTPEEREREYDEVTVPPTPAPRPGPAPTPPGGS